MSEEPGALIRKRGWSIHSESVCSEAEELTQEEKHRFLAIKVPTALEEEEEGMMIERPPRKRARNDDEDKDEDDDFLELSKESQAEGHKRMKGDDLEATKAAAAAAATTTTTQDETTTINGGLSSSAKITTTTATSTTTSTTTTTNTSRGPPAFLKNSTVKLSKWCARLFDPDRPRGLVEAPQVIPLNDEFLQAFGRREKEFDQKLGREIKIENKIEEVPDDDDAAALLQNAASTRQSKEPLEGRKVRLMNLTFTLTQEKLTQAVAAFVQVEDVNLIMDKDSLGTNKPKNTGRAYVTFFNAEDAESFIRRCKTIEGRPLRCTLAASQSAKQSTTGSSGAGGMPRYWEKNIGIKCFRCKQVGHMDRDCPNEAKLKPCALCGKLDHEMWDCTMRQICFNCGIPGHVARACTYPRGMPKRVVCGICYNHGHSRLTCRIRANFAPTKDAKCLVCGQIGHFMCKEMKWFFGLDGVTCFNCGRADHLGLDCDRPLLDQCARDSDLAASEIARAEATSLVDELNKLRNGGLGRGRERARDPRRLGHSNASEEYEDPNIYRPRAKSQPPPPPYRGYGNDGYNNTNNNPGWDQGNARGYHNRGGPPPPPPPPRGPPQRGYSSGGGGGGRAHYFNNQGRGNTTNQTSRGYGNSRGYRNDQKYPPR